jgi:hypothetical protein
MSATPSTPLTPRVNLPSTVAVCKMWTDEMKFRVIFEIKKNLYIRTSQKPDATGEYCGMSREINIRKIKFIWH